MEPAGILDTLASYIEFQNPDGKEQTEKFLKRLMRSKVDGSRFISKARYKNLPFGKRFIDRWSKNVCSRTSFTGNSDNAAK